MDRFICVHGHFYQPPRENPWLETIQVQDSAYPFHDWNERVSRESYGPNAAARILDDENRILEIINNYSRISFNFGPTLLAWMEAKDRETYEAILAADKLSQERFSGHGSAMAQNFNHMIMPLSNRADKETQIIWGIADFEHRFGRKPEGMWLAETGVDVESLELMAKHGIIFTVLAPHQAGKIREIGEEEWVDVSGSRVDPTRPYLVNLPSGDAITIFFYDGPVSRAVAFEGLLNRGEFLADRMLGIFSDERDWPQIVHIATDGETYGHHHKNGEMALAYALHYIEENGLAELTNYGEYLERFPPTHEAEIIEDTSWSCVHGVERWRSNCGCNTGGGQGWTQEWREPLREALDWLRDETVPIYQELGGQLFNDPWAARDDYIHVVLDRSPESVEGFFAGYASHHLSPEERICALKLLEMQRHAMLMYTSCGWFFDELSGIETVQVIEYAARAVELADGLAGGNLEEGFIERLEPAKSNIPRFQNGAVIYERMVKPARVDHAKVAAHYAMSALFTEEPPSSVYSFEAEPEVFMRDEAGRAQLGLGRVQLQSRITGERGLFTFGVLHFGDHNLDGGVRIFRDEEQFEDMAEDVSESFSRADFPETIRRIDRHFGEHSFTLGTLFRDEQRNITDVILTGTLADAESVYRHLYEDNAALMRYLDSIAIPLPRALRTAAEFIMNADISRVLGEDPVDLEYIQSYFSDTESWGLELDVPGISFAMNRALERHSARLMDDDVGPELFGEIIALIDTFNSLPINGDLWTAQNDYYEAFTTRYPEMKACAEGGNAEAAAWVESFKRLGETLAFKIQ